MVQGKPPNNSLAAQTFSRFSFALSLASKETEKNVKMTFLLQCNRVSRQCARVLINKVKRVKWLLAIFQDVLLVLPFVDIPAAPSLLNGYVYLGCGAAAAAVKAPRTSEGKQMRVHVWCQHW